MLTWLLASSFEAERVAVDQTRPLTFVRLKRSPATTDASSNRVLSSMSEVGLSLVYRRVRFLVIPHKGPLDSYRIHNGL